MAEPVFVRDNRFQASLGCPNCPYAVYVSSSDPLTKRGMIRDYGPILAAHNCARTRREPKP